MARQGNHGQADTRSVNWSDVARLIKQLEAQYGGHVELTFDCEGTRGGQDAIWVRAKLYESFRVVDERPTDVCSALWPTGASRTMAGLSFRLLHQLDHCADSRLRAEGGGMPF